MPHDLRYFISYARKDKDQVQRLLDGLHPRLAIARGYSFSAWIDDQIQVGERWTDAIEQALATCDLGLMLLSPNFFASGFIRREELPVFVETIRHPSGNLQTRIHKPLVPVLLQDLPLDGSADLAGLEQLQVFRDREGRSFRRTRGHTADAFADQLVEAILAKLRRLYPTAAA